MHTTASIDHKQIVRIRRTPLDFFAIFAGLLLVTLLTLVLSWQFWHSNRVYTGVSIGGIPLGGETRAGAISQLNGALGTFPHPPVTLFSHGKQWSLPSAQLRGDFDLAATVNEAYLIGRNDDFSGRLRAQLVAALAGTDIQPVLQYDTALLRQSLSDIATTVRAPARSQRQVGDVVIPATIGFDVDVELTLAKILQALAQADDTTPIQVPLAIFELAPDATPTAGTPQSTVGGDALQPLVLANAQSGFDIALDPDTLERVIFAREPLQIDTDVLRTILLDLNQQFGIPPRDARLRFDESTGAVGILQSSQAGRAIDIEATVASAVAALEQGTHQAELIIRAVPPLIDMNRIAEMGIRELVASGTTYFGGSSAARVRNIEVAAEKFEGLVIPPGENFSFNEFVEDVSAANGFEDSLIIWGDRTAVGVGGGVCQVSTTIFRAAFEAGLPIVERYNHGYVVDWYGEPGLDATIYTPTVDFRFHNDTSAYLLVDPVVNSATGTITFNLYGTKPARQVVISEPTVTEQLEPDVASYQVDDAFSIGQVEQVEWSKQGMTVEVERTIIENGESRIDKVTSHYQPWRAVFLVGAGTLLPDGSTAAP